MSATVTAPVAARRDLASLRWLVLVGLAVVAGIALRVWVYRSSMGVPDSDEAVVGLMALHVLDGELPVFFWGQGFGGSQEAILTAPLFWAFGPSWLALRLVPIALTAAAAVVVWRVGRRTIGEPAAIVAGCLAWIWPPFLIQRLTHQFGFYAGGLLYSALLLLVGLRLVERPSRARAALFGLVIGLALWQSAQVLPVAVAVVAWTLWSSRAGCVMPGSRSCSRSWARCRRSSGTHGTTGAGSTRRSPTRRRTPVGAFLSPLLGMLLGSARRTRRSGCSRPS